MEQRGIKRHRLELNGVVNQQTVRTTQNYNIQTYPLLATHQQLHTTQRTETPT